VPDQFVESKCEAQVATLTLDRPPDNIMNIEGRATQWRDA
jgi:hypothetical protein